MPCQDTLYWNRIDDDPHFAQVAKLSAPAAIAAMEAEAELCRIGRLLAKDGLIGEINFPSIPTPMESQFADEWGERIRQRVNEEIQRARDATNRLRTVQNGTISDEAKAWLAQHWLADIRWKEADNERHKREIQTRRYSTGAKHEKRVARIAADTPEIEELRQAIAWATA